MAAKPKVVVIGGGPGGAQVARDPALNRVAEVTLIDTKDYFEITTATLRSFVEPDWADKVTWKHQDYLKKVGAALLVGVVTRVDANAVHLADGRTAAFDYVVIATGSTTASIDKLPDSKSVTREARAAWFRAEAELLGAAKSVLVVGGGAVGVEFAGEVLTDMPGKPVTIVQSGAKLFAGGTPAVPDSYANGTAKWLTSKGATLIFNERVDTQGASRSTPGATYTTSGGKSVQADYVFLAVGAPPCTGFYDPAKLDAARRITVDESLMVKGAKGHFAIGDCAATEDAKYAYTATKQGEHVAKVIVNLIKGKGGAPAKYAKQGTVQLLSLGRSAGRMLLPFGECPQCCAVSIKSKDLMVGFIKGQFAGLK